MKSCCSVGKKILKDFSLETSNASVFNGIVTVTAKDIGKQQKYEVIDEKNVTTHVP